METLSSTLWWPAEGGRGSCWSSPSLSLPIYAKRRLNWDKPSKTRSHSIVVPIVHSTYEAARERGRENSSHFPLTKKCIIIFIDTLIISPFGSIYKM
jgi:hypothetical protein